MSNKYELKSATQLRAMLKTDLSLLDSLLEYADNKYKTLYAKQKFYRASLWDELYQDALFLTPDYVHCDETKEHLKKLWPMHKVLIPVKSNTTKPVRCPKTGLVLEILKSLTPSTKAYLRRSHGYKKVSVSPQAMATKYREWQASRSN